MPVYSLLMVIMTNVKLVGKVSSFDYLIVDVKLVSRMWLKID